MQGWNREFQYLPAKTISKIGKYQYLPAKTIHFSLSHLTLSSLSHIPLSPLFSWLWLHSQLLSVTLGHPAFDVCSHASLQRAELEADYSCVRPSVRPCVPLLGEAQNICFCSILSEISENHLCILQYLATVALKTPHKIDTVFVKCSKHTIKWEVEIVNFNTSHLKS